MDADRRPALEFDVLIVGSGLAGLTAALHLAPACRVALLTKRILGDSASSLAQGGIAAVLAEDDSLDDHVNDTLVAGAGLCDPLAARLTVERAPAAVAWLQALGVPFSEELGRLHLTREGGHSARRVAHVTDATGAAVQRTLIAKVRATTGITLFEHHMLVDLAMADAAPGQPARCLGLHALDETSGQVQTFRAGHTLLATGGCGQVYQHTTSPATSTGDGIAAAWRAGCQVANMEFVQFHPTCLHHPEAQSFLISEAVRGEGGHLRLPAGLGGERFMPAHDQRAELAPRDVVARGIDAEMKRHGIPCVYLDISHQPPAFLLAHFPNIHARCLALGIDIATQAIPVVPAAHYTCGGVLTDLHGRTGTQGLYAIGETACTGLHGANRLASNSLVECMVFAMAAAAEIASQPRRAQPEAPATLAAPNGLRPASAEDMAAISQACADLRRLMWEDAGIVRTNQGLDRAAGRLAQLGRTIEALDSRCAVTRELLELRNLAAVAGLIVRSALSRQESRGLHFNLDYPALASTALPTVLTP